jgi:hypothetical protein
MRNNVCVLNRNKSSDWLEAGSCLTTPSQLSSWAGSSLLHYAVLLQGLLAMASGTACWTTQRVPATQPHRAPSSHPWDVSTITSPTQICFMDSGSIQSEYLLAFSVSGWPLRFRVCGLLTGLQCSSIQTMPGRATHCAALHDHRYYPIQRPCDMLWNFQQVPAVFDGLIAYKNGVKGAMATQVGTAH